MKKLVLLLSALILAVSACTPEKEIKKLLADEFPGASFDVGAIGGPMDLYTPFEALNSLKIRFARDGADGLADDVINVMTALNDLETYTRAFPEKPTRKAVKAEITTAGQTAPVYFFYNSDGETLGHSSLYLQREFSTFYANYERALFGGL